MSPETYFRSEAELAQYTNSFYTLEPNVGDFRWFMESGELIQHETLPREIAGTRPLPSAAGDVGWNWGTLRNINYYLQNSSKCTVRFSTTICSPNSAKYHGMINLSAARIPSCYVSRATAAM